MRTVIFRKGNQIVGILSLQSGLTLTQEHLNRLELAGISAWVSNAPIAKHDGNVNQWVDTLLESGNIGTLLPLHHEPDEVTPKTKFAMNDAGRFLVEVDGKRSNPVTYQSIATLQVGDKLYAGVSAYYSGALPHETVFEVRAIPGCENVEENFDEPQPLIKD